MQPLQFLTVKTIDLAKSAGRSKYQWSQQTRQYFKLQVAGAKSLGLSRPKDSPRHHLKERRAEKATARLSCQYKEP